MPDRVAKPKLKEYVLSERITGPDGEPLRVKMGPVQQKENDDLIDRFTDEYGLLDASRYGAELAALCIREPKVGSAELCSAYGVTTGGEVLRVMLTSGEFLRLATTVRDVCGLNDDFGDLVEESKN